MKGGSELAGGGKVTKANVIRCKRIKGGRAGCYIKYKGKTVFRFANPSYLSGLGIPIVGAKLLPGFAGKKRRKRSRKSRRPTPKMRAGCKRFSNGRIGCPTPQGFRIIG